MSKTARKTRGGAPSQRANAGVNATLESSQETTEKTTGKTTEKTLTVIHSSAKSVRDSGHFLSAIAEFVIDYALTIGQ